MKKSILFICVLTMSTFFAACKGSDKENIANCNEEVRGTFFNAMTAFGVILVGQGEGAVEDAFDIESYSDDLSDDSKITSNIAKFENEDDDYGAVEEVCTEFKAAIGNKTCKLTIEDEETGKQRSAAIHKNIFKGACKNKKSEDEN